MNTIMEEKIKQAFQEWKQAEQPQQPKETNVQAQTANHRLSTILMNKIKDTPGITGKELRMYAQRVMPNVVPSHVPALLKQFFDAGAVNRVETHADIAAGRTSFAYTFVPEDQRVRRMKKGASKAKPKAKVKAAPAPAPASAPAPFHTPLQNVTYTPLPNLPSAESVIDNMSVGEAFKLYQKLSTMFGGAR